MVSAFVAALALGACTAPAARPAPPVPSRATLPPPPSRTPARPAPLAYVPDLAPGARHTLVGVSGRLYVYDDAGRLVSSRRTPRGWAPYVTRGADGTTYVTMSDYRPPTHVYSYDDGELTPLTEADADLPDRFASTSALYGIDGGAHLVQVLPRKRGARWPFPLVDQMQPGAKGTLGMGREGPGTGAPLAVVTTGRGPVAATALETRCTVTAARGGQLVLDAPLPYHWAFCGAAAVDEDGMLALLVRHAGAYGDERDDLSDEVLLVRVDPVTLEVVGRTPVLSGLRQQLDGLGGLVALPGGLVAFVRDRDRSWVVDLRGGHPVPHEVPAALGDRATAAGPDAVFLWGDATIEPRAVSGVTVSTGRVERGVLRPPGVVTAVVRVR
jgi:hypothetical protein